MKKLESVESCLKKTMKMMEEAMDEEVAEPMNLDSGPDLEVVDNENCFLMEVVQQVEEVEVIFGRSLNSEVVVESASSSVMKSEPELAVEEAVEAVAVHHFA